MGTKIRTKGNSYVLKSLEDFKNYLLKLRTPNKCKSVPKQQISIEGLQMALQIMERQEREAIEKFWGLRGGINHSKKGRQFFIKDKGLLDLSQRAYNAVKKMSKLDIARIYDSSVNQMVDFIAYKIDKDGVSNITNYESVKYLMAFLLIVENGPKMPFETATEVETKIDNQCYLDEYEALREMCQELEEYKEKSINLSLIISLFEMMDFKDWITVKENFGIKNSEVLSLQEIQFLKSIGINADEIIAKGKVEDFTSFSNIREFKERVFKYATWEVASTIILGHEIDLEGFIAEIVAIGSNDWISKIEGFKTGDKKIVVTTKETRELQVYRIGSLEFTDPNEIDFLYLNLQSA